MAALDCKLYDTSNPDDHLGRSGRGRENHMSGLATDNPELSLRHAVVEELSGVVTAGDKARIADAFRYWCRRQGRLAQCFPEVEMLVREAGLIGLFISTLLDTVRISGIIPRLNTHLKRLARQDNFMPAYRAALAAGKQPRAAPGRLRAPRQTSPASQRETIAKTSLTLVEHLYAGATIPSKKLQTLVAEFSGAGKLADLVGSQGDSKPAISLSLSIVVGAGKIALDRGQFESFAEQVHNLLRDNHRVGIQSDRYLSKITREGRDKRLQRLVFKVKYAGFPQVGDRLRIFETASKLADRIEVDEDALTWVFKQRGDDSIDWPAWLSKVRTAYALEHIIRDTRISDGEISELLDPAAVEACKAQIDPDKGHLVVVAHAGFGYVRGVFIKHLLAKQLVLASRDVRDEAISVREDPHTALFIAIKSLLGGTSVTVAVDGKQGRCQNRIMVLGKPYFISDGGAFLAYESRCQTFWCEIKRVGERLQPQLKPGPQRADGEKYRDYKARFLSFYETMLNQFFTGNPESILLSQRWLQTFSGKVANDGGQP